MKLIIRSFRVWLANLIMPEEVYDELTHTYCISDLRTEIRRRIKQLDEPEYKTKERLDKIYESIGRYYETNTNTTKDNF